VPNKDTWYERIPAQERAAVDAAAKWLRPVRWQWFISLTFTWNVRGETADRKFKKWVNLVERGMRSRMCFVAGKERKPSSHGMEVPWHFHVLVTSLAEAPKELLQKKWTGLVGSGTRREADGVVVEESILVEPYEGHLKGPEYCLKSMNDCNGDWLFRWLELFNPGIKQTTRPNHRSLVQRKRFDEQRRRQGATLLQHRDHD
jgi:hypothetical protein